MEAQIFTENHDPNQPINLSKLTNDELVDILALNVIYDTDDFIAFNKPYNIPYSGSKPNRIQIDRVLQEVKKRICPTVPRLYLAESLDRAASGVLLFAKTDEQRKSFQESLANEHVGHRFRCLVRGIPHEETATIAIPLHKMMNGKDIKMLPAIKKTSGKVYHLKTKYRLVNHNRIASISVLDVFVSNASLHQIRSHLAFGVNCPLIGEQKYNPNELDKNIALSNRALEPLGFQSKDFRKIPMFIHLAETLIPKRDKTQFSVVKAPMPTYFLNALKSLSLLKK
ncbi:RNA pseudouridylate synthase domain-containing protein 4 [Aphelenchoides besseyi]|nr:RNA pseudouridylate synthase domain-containing protein 4 [Aphelenchoides besseyi]